MIELYAIFEGNVQGVGFRATTKRKADELRLSGFVKNLPTGTVEVLAQGSEQSLKTLLQFLISHFESPKKAEYRPITKNYQNFMSL